MNIFTLDKDPRKAAQYHNDKHVVRMILESAQLLSTAHRMVDGAPYEDRTANNRRILRWKLADTAREHLLLKATHVNHPCNVWVRSHGEHYRWLAQLFSALLDEYTRRYGKDHAYSKTRHPALYSALRTLPSRMIQTTTASFAPPQAMPDIYKVTNPSDPWGATVDAYHRYYRGAKTSFSTWKNQSVPAFMQQTPAEHAIY